MGEFIDYLLFHVLFHPRKETETETGLTEQRNDLLRALLNYHLGYHTQLYALYIYEGNSQHMGLFPQYLEEEIKSLVLLSITSRNLLENLCFLPCKLMLCCI